MSILIKKATVVDPQSKHHLKKVDILVENSKITDIKTNISFSAKKVFQGPSLFASPGWMDVHAQFNDPGFEHKESLKTGAAAAANGGFTTVIIAGNNQPVTDAKAQISYITNASAKLPIEIKTFATLSEGLKGQNFSEMYDLQSAGAVGFSDGLHPINNPDLLKRAMQYSQTFNGIIVSFPHDKRISHGGLVNESPTSTSLGLKSDPSLSEEIMVARDLAIAEYCEAPIHFMTISSANSVAQIKRAKKRGIRVTCDVAIANLLWNDTVLTSFNSNYKVWPPLRSEKDRKALIKGINEGIIDAIVTNHNPQNIEEKQCEFDHASFGQTSLDTAYSLYNTHLSNQIDLETWVKAISLNSRRIFKQEISSIAIGNKANITLFDTMDKWEVTEKEIKSKSKNTPSIGQTLTGKVIAVIC